MPGPTKVVRPTVVSCPAPYLYDSFMPNFRRAHVPGGSFFFTLVTDRRVPLFAEPRARLLLGSAIRRCLVKWPFQINAIVLLPEHLHAIWTLPAGDDQYATRWGWIKKEFTKAWMQIGDSEQSISRGRQ